MEKKIGCARLRAAPQRQKTTGNFAQNRLAQNRLAKTWILREFLKIEIESAGFTRGHWRSLEGIKDDFIALKVLKNAKKSFFKKSIFDH